MAVARMLVYCAGSGFDDLVPPESISELLPDGRNVVWLDIQDPSEADVELLRQEFGFHELSLEDVVHRHQRPKVDRFEGYHFMVAYVARIDGFQEIALFVGENYMVTVHRGEVSEISETAARWRTNADRIEPGIGVLVYSLLDAIVDGYFPVVDEISERVESLQTAIVAGRRDCLEDVFELKRYLLDLRRMTAPLRDVLNVLIRRDEPIFGRNTLVYFQDVYDHSIRVIDSVDLYRDQVSGLLDAYLTVASNRLNETMKRMTAVATILMSVTVVASMYGMNYPLWPPQDWPSEAAPQGFWFAVGAMAAIGLSLALWLRRIDWL